MLILVKDRSKKTKKMCSYQFSKDLKPKTISNTLKFIFQFSTLE